ncbi:MAG TPA: L-threonylcarbamoyladenylate synthase [Pyrinomonadaceae bacterium]|nr:L-threonylcarbamoyladenylate synthase [Pyrinomonadaceae bacterium]
MDSQQSHKRAAEVIARGGVIAFRTDTFYGLGADPFNRGAVQRIKQLKGREASKPILVVISDIDQIERFISERSRTFDLLAERFWPGPLTLIGKASPEVPDEITAGSGTIGIRLPDDDETRVLIRSCGGALTATSANPSGAEPARTVEEVERYFGAAVDLIIDGGEARTNAPSTVVDTTGAETRVVREGVITAAEVEGALSGLRSVPPASAGGPIAEPAS